MTLERGRILNNRYRILEVLGQGGMGAVYHAVDENLGMDVAVKENLFQTEDFARQFHREAIILAGLRHPNLPRVTDHFVIEGQGQYLVMDYIEGEDLSERIDRSGPLTEAEVVVLGIAICEALSYLHSCQPKVLHRDIKPGNVKITPKGNICLVDFGLAKVVEGGQITTTGARAMTPGYSPPEQYGTARTDHRTDIYSLGATLYVALTGVIPEDALVRVMGQAELVPIRKHDGKISRRMAAAVEKAMALRPDDRYQSADRFKEALLNAQGVEERLKPEQLVLSPPPVDSTNVDAEGEVQDRPGRMQAGVSPDTPPGSQRRSSSPGRSADSVPLFANQSRKRRRRRVLYGVSLVLLALILSGGTWAYYSQPDVIRNALAWVAPFIELDGTESVPTRFETETPYPLSTETPAPTSSPTPNQTSGANGIPTEDLVTETVAVVIPELTQTPSPSPSPTPTATATLIGGGLGQIAYASDITGEPQIWLVNIDGTGHQRITDMPDGACQPNWAPDGLQLVFISPCPSNQELYPGASLFIINADGTGLTPLPSTPGGDFDPAWSPDGEWIAFTSLRDYNRPQIYAIKLDDLSVHPVSDNLVRDMQPAWSPDGEKIAFITTRRGPAQVWKMNSDGSEAILFSRSGDKKNSRPVWSPDGKVILFTQADVYRGVPRLIAVRIVEGTPVENVVVRDPTPMREGVYSPDGFWIAYEGWPVGTSHNIYIMTANGLARQQLTSDDGYDFDPAWRPVHAEP